jgi:hypothetical protein
MHYYEGQTARIAVLWCFLGEMSCDVRREAIETNWIDLLLATQSGLKSRILFGVFLPGISFHELLDGDL